MGRHSTINKGRMWQRNRGEGEDGGGGGEMTQHENDGGDGDGDNGDSGYDVNFGDSSRGWQRW